MATTEQRRETGKKVVRASKGFERRVANLFTQWSGVKFRRRRVEGRDNAVRVVELVADVIPCAGDFNFTIECKKGKGFSLDSLMKSPSSSQFTKWWHQTCYDAQLLTKDLKRQVYPMMFFKPIPAWDWVAFSSHARFLPHLHLASSIHSSVARDPSILWFPHLKFDQFDRVVGVNHDVSHSKKNAKMVNLVLDPVIICRWNDFAENILPQSTFCSYPSEDERARVASDEED